MTLPADAADDGRTSCGDRAGDSGAAPGAAWSAAADDYDRWWADLGAPVWDVLLDIGCGPGRFLRRAADRGAILAGIDAAERMVELAHRRVPDADVVCADMERLPWAEASFDVVTAINAIQFADDPAVAVAEIARVVAPGGRVGVCVWGPREGRHGLVIDRAVRALVPDDDAP